MVEDQLGVCIHAYIHTHKHTQEEAEQTLSTSRNNRIRNLNVRLKITAILPKNTQV